MRLLKSVVFFAAVAAVVAFAQTPAFANTLTTYTLTNASWNDGSSFNGNWTVDWTTNSITALYFNHGAGTTTPFTATATGPSQASVFNVADKLTDYTTQVADVYELNAWSTDLTQYLNLDFYRATGSIYIGASDLGSNLDIGTTYSDNNYQGYVSINASGGNIGTSAAATPEPGTVMLMGSGILSMLGLRKRKNLFALFSRKECLSI